MTEQSGKQQAALPSSSRRPSSGDSASTPGYASTLEERARKQAKAERRFYEQLFAFLGTLALLFVIDLLTGPGWWFYWLAVGWGIALVGQAVRIFSPANRFDDAWEDQKARDLMAKGQRSPQAASTAQTTSTGVSELIGRGEREVATMRADAVQMTKPEVQAQALRICSRSDQILKVLAEPDRDEQLGRDFVDRVLPTAQTVFSSYARLSERQIASAEPALERVETHDLPVIERTLNDIYQQLHRHDVISLEVASEMLELGKPGN